jgi:amidase
MCGTAALKPTVGRVADAALTPPAIPPLSLQFFNTQGPMARRISDLRLALGLLAGRDARDPRWVPAPFGVAKPGVKPRVALAAGMIEDAHVRAGVERAGSLLANAGYELTELELPGLEELNDAWFTLLGADFFGAWPQLKPAAGRGLLEFVERVEASGVMNPAPAAKLAHTWMARHRIGAEWAELQTRFPIILAPVCCERPWPVGADLTRLTELARAMRMVLPVNVLGLPACSVPVGHDDGLPQGVQLIGARFGEEALLDAAEAIEASVVASTPREPNV